MQTLLVTCYSNPDLDGFACVLAYTEYLNKTGRNATPAIFGGQQREPRYMADLLKIDWPAEITNPQTYEQVVLVDASDLYAAEHWLDPEKVTEIIDHRKVHQAHIFPNARVQIELVGAAATLIAEKYQENNIDISPTAAALLCGAIISNTLNFKSKTTTNRDKNAYSWLNQTAKLPANFAHSLFQAKSELPGQTLIHAMNLELGTYKIGDMNLGISQLEIIGAKDLVAKRENDILAKLAEMKQRQNLDHIFMTIIDLGEGLNQFITDDPAIQDLLTKIFKIEFNGNVAIYPQLIMRKEIVPLIKESVEHGVS